MLVVSDAPNLISPSRTIQQTASMRTSTNSNEPEDVHGVKYEDLTELEVIILMLLKDVIISALKKLATKVLLSYCIQN